MAFMGHICMASMHDAGKLVEKNVRTSSPL